MIGFLKNILARFLGIEAINQKVVGLYNKTEWDKNHITKWIDKNKEEILFSQGQILVQLLLKGKLPKSLHEVEFKVFSQNGEDGIIQYIVSQIKDIPKIFIEFGVETYQESNTKFLLLQNNWKGLIIDGSEANINFVKNSDFYWRTDLTACCHFIDNDNINSIFSSNGFNGEIGILSVDIDGNDYWVWENISLVDPVIVIAEYNSYFGNERAISVPYDKAFYRSKAHYSNLYFGASLAALTYLAEKKGYSLVGCNTSGNNAFFVKNSHLNGMNTYSATQAFIDTPCREARNIDGTLSFANIEERKTIIKGLPVVNVITGELEAI